MSDKNFTGRLRLLPHVGALYAMLMAAIFVAIPAPIRTSALFSKIATIPKLVWKMVLNIQKIDHKNTTFIHTTHDKK